MIHALHANRPQRAVLERIAEAAMLDRGLLPAFSPAVSAELQALTLASGTSDGSIRDLTDFLWTSIDNDDSRDLDQLTVGERLPEGTARILIAVADVEALVQEGSAIDQHARHNTTSVYTAARIFPMLPERLSTDLTSLNPGEERLAVVVDMIVGADGSEQSSEVYRARVLNHAKLAYNSVAAWLDGDGAPPPAIAAVAGLAENLRLQAQAGQSLRQLRHLRGSLSLETVQSKPTFEGDRIRSLEVEQRNQAKEMIEDFMIAANGVTARYLETRRFPSIRRVVRTPKRWDRIVDLARERGARLPATPDAVALNAFLVAARAADPVRFPDLSLAVIKLLGAGEYVAEQPGTAAPGHFGLAVKDYTHSTAPNRRYPDLVTQRLLKAAIAGRPAPYRYAQLEALATHFTQAGDAANKVERQVGKSAAAMLLESRIGEVFAALVTGAGDKGTWARLLSIPVEGRVVRGSEGLDTGEQVRVRLVSVDIERGFIDFERVSHGSA